MRFVELAAPIAQSAGDLADRWALRGIDAMHLASAMALLPDSLVLATWDRDLAEAAVRAGLATAGIT